MCCALKAFPSILAGYFHPFIGGHYTTIPSDLVVTPRVYRHLQADPRVTVASLITHLTPSNHQLGALSHIRETWRDYETQILQR
jgi:hypothetical protein